MKIDLKSALIGILAPLLISLGAFPATGFAQTHSGSGRVIEEVIVTATKRSESLRDIPASIANFSGEDLERQGKMDQADFIRETPGVTINNASPGVARISIRGVGVDNGAGATLAPTVGILIGDTSFADPYINGVTPDLSAFDLSSVQILKGPQGTVFGGSALSGAIRYVLQEPSLEGTEGKVFTQYSNPEHGGEAFTSGVAWNVPLVEDKLAARFGYVQRDYPGLYDNTRTGRKDVNEGGGEQLRGLVSWFPTDRLRVDFTYLTQDYETDDGLVVADNRYERSYRYALLEVPNENEFSMKTLETEYAFDSFSVKAIASHTDKDQYIFQDISLTFFNPIPDPRQALQGLPLPIDLLPEDPTRSQALYQEFGNTSSSISYELRAQSQPGEWWADWLIGAYKYDYDMIFWIYVNYLALDEPIGANNPDKNDTSELSRRLSLLYGVNDAKVTEDAIFFDVKKTFWGSLDIQVGARFYETAVIGGYDMVGVLARAANNGNEVGIREKIPEEGVSPKVSATYHFNDDISTYAQASRGFRFGGVQTIPANEAEGIPPVFKSDSLWNYEIGLRTAWLDNSLQFDVVAFLIDYTDPQVLQQSESSNLAYKDNVGSAESTGFEASLFWLTPIDGLALSLNGGRLDAHTSEEFVDSAGNVIPAGTQMPGAADKQYSATVSYSDVLWGVGFNSYVSYTYVGKNFGDLAQTEAVNDYGVLNAGMSFVMQDSRFRPQLSVNVSNIRDVIAPIGGGSREVATGDRQELYIMNAPRTVNARLSFEF